MGRIHTTRKKFKALIVYVTVLLGQVWLVPSYKTAVQVLEQNSEKTTVAFYSICRYVAWIYEFFMRRLVPTITTWYCFIKKLCYC